MILVKFLRKIKIMCESIYTPHVELLFSKGGAM